MLMICRPDWEYGRNMMLGARHYAFTRGSIEAGNGLLAPGESVKNVVRQQHIDGIIAVVQDREFEKELLRLPIPVVNVSNVLSPSHLPMVTQDDFQVGTLAAEHLIACGCLTFACWEQKETQFSRERLNGFQTALERHLPGAPFFLGGSGRLTDEQGSALTGRMRKWLRKLPPQTGIFAVLDPFALHLLQAAREENRNVPESLAVLGAGDDEFWVDFERIPLSSVKLPSWQIGMEAARLLETLMQEGAKTANSIHLPVTEVATRRSTDVIFVEDQAVLRAVTFIRQHASENIYVGDVVRASGISRSGLQRKFAATLGKSILDEIQRVRITRVQTLLRTTDLKLSAIAEACNFSDTPRLHVLFRQLTNRTPGEYRAMFKRK